LIVALCHKGLVVAEFPCVGLNLVVNPSFESPESLFIYQFYPFDGIAGWSGGSVDSLECPDPEGLELHLPLFCPGWVSVEGDQWTEMDSSACNVFMFQEIPTEAGKQYFLKYHYSPRGSENCEPETLIPASSNVLNVYVNGALVNSVAKAGKLGDMQWEVHTHVITAVGTTTIIEFAGAGTNDGFGAFLDMVTLCEIAPCSPAGPCHTVGRDANGACVYPQDDEALCNDGNECTDEDKCVAGKCVGTPKNCGSGDNCHYPFCDYTTGDCIDSVIPDGTECDTGECTVGQCECGVCTVDDKRRRC